MNNTDKDIPNEFLDQLFSNTYHELSEQELKNKGLSQEDMESCHTAMKLIGLSRTELKLDAGLKPKLMLQFEQMNLKKSKSISAFWLKTAAIVLLVLSNVLLINYYLGNGPSIAPNVSGADTGVHSGQKDTIRTKTGDSIQSYKKDTVLAALPLAQFIMPDCEKFFLNSIVVFHRMKYREFHASLDFRTNYSI